MSTARTAVGCLAEDYSTELATICAEWLDAHERYFEKHPKELDEKSQVQMDVARSFVDTVLKAAS